MSNTVNIHGNSTESSMDFTDVLAVSATTLLFAFAFCALCLFLRHLCQKKEETPVAVITQAK